MSYSRILQYAAVQAGIRARIGMMPEAGWWIRQASGDAADAAREVLGHPGLVRWARDLPSHPGPRTIERHLNGKLRTLVSDSLAWLPPIWSDTVDHLRLVPDILWLQGVLAGLDLGASLDRDSSLNAALGVAPEQREAALRGSGLERYIGGSTTPLEAWWDCLPESFPPLAGAEKAALDRLTRLLFSYAEERYRLCRELDTNVQTDHELENHLEKGFWPAQLQWVERLRGCLAGDSFHGVTVLIYLLLEYAQMCNLRAVMVGWALDYGGEWAA